jgi:phage terminase large subunit-like protein
VVLVVPRKNGKTTLLAAYGLYRLLFDTGQPEILLAASSDRQAGRLFDAAVAFIRRSPYLLERLVVREYIGEIARRDGGGRMLRMSSDHRALHGYNPSLVIPDELAQWTTPGLAAPGRR